jgi:long-chain acyl-CoA synthetase
MEARVFYNKSIETLLPTIKIAKPHIMTAVPRFYNNLFAKMQIGLKNQSNFKQSLFNKTILLGTKKLHGQKLSINEKILNILLDKLVRSKVKNNFGGRLEAFVSGGGPLDSRVGEALNALGLKTLQGYGLTETSPVVSCNPLQKIKVETVGPIFPGVEVKLANDGEILVRGENLMIGYWNNIEATNETIKDGWLHTGDIGEFDNEGYLKITDRKKDIIVSLGGDNIAPSKIENLLTLSSDIEQACVFGEQKNYIAALIILSTESKALNDDIQNYINEINSNLTQPEKIKKFQIINEPFSIENNLMTPTMKVRRHEVEKKYAEIINQLF